MVVCSRVSVAYWRGLLFGLHEQRKLALVGNVADVLPSGLILLPGHRSRGLLIGCRFRRWLGFHITNGTWLCWGNMCCWIMQCCCRHVIWLLLCHLYLLARNPLYFCWLLWAVCFLHVQRVAGRLDARRICSGPLTLLGSTEQYGKLSTLG